MFRFKLLVIGALCVACGDRNLPRVESTDVLPDIVIDSRDTQEPILECVDEVAVEIGKGALEIAGSVGPIEEPAKSTKTNVELGGKRKRSLLSGNRAIAKPRASIQPVNVPRPSLPRSKPIPADAPRVEIAPPPLPIPTHGKPIELGEPIDIGKQGRVYAPKDGRAGIGIRF